MCVGERLGVSMCRGWRKNYTKALNSGFNLYNRSAAADHRPISIFVLMLFIVL